MKIQFRGKCSGTSRFTDVICDGKQFTYNEFAEFVNGIHSQLITEQEKNKQLQVLPRIILRNLKAGAVTLGWIQHHLERVLKETEQELPQRQLLIVRPLGIGRMTEMIKQLRPEVDIQESTCQTQHKQLRKILDKCHKGFLYGELTSSLFGEIEKVLKETE